MKFQKLVTNISPLVNVHFPTQEGQQIQNWSKQKRNLKIGLWNSNGKKKLKQKGRKKKMTPHIWMSNPVRSHLGPKGNVIYFLIIKWNIQGIRIHMALRPTQGETPAWSGRVHKTTASTTGRCKINYWRWLYGLVKGRKHFCITSFIYWL